MGRDLGKKWLEGVSEQASEDGWPTEKGVKVNLSLHEAGLISRQPSVARVRGWPRWEDSHPHSLEDSGQEISDQEVEAQSLRRDHAHFAASLGLENNFQRGRQTGG